MMEDMVREITGIGGNDFESMKTSFDNRVGFEDSDFCKDMLKKEVSEFQDLDAFVE